MKEYIITIDGGTTNTRCILWNGEHRKLAEAKRETGAGSTAADGNNLRLKTAIKECIHEVLEKGNIAEQDVDRIIGSGEVFAAGA